MNFKIIVLLIMSGITFQSCSDKPEGKEWIKDAVIYEVNTQLYGPDGDFKSLQKELPRIQKLGVDVLWIMPVHPRSKIMSGGTMGIPYAPSNYFEINENYGTKEDFKNLVTDIHARGMKVILDEVPNHCGWDNVLIKEHPEYFVHDSLGNICHAYVFTPMAQLDYSKQEVRDFMLSVMKYWVQEFDVDGYRMDCSWAVPIDFWETAIAELNKVKPVLMLAEAEGTEYHKAGFDMTFAWDFMILRGDMTNHDKNVRDLDMLMEAEQRNYQKEDIRMYFTTNHDEDGIGGTKEEEEEMLKVFDAGNVSTTSYSPPGWTGLPGIARESGRSFARLKGATKAFAVFTFTAPGMPLIYNGQETAYESRANGFLSKEYIDFQNHDMTDFYSQLIDMKHKNQALWNGVYGGDYIRIENGADSSVVSFIRKKDDNKVLTIINFTDEVQAIEINSDLLIGGYVDLYKDAYFVDNLNGKHFMLAPYEYRIFMSN